MRPAVSGSLLQSARYRASIAPGAGIPGWRIPGCAQPVMRRARRWRCPVVVDLGSGLAGVGRQDMPGVLVEPSFRLISAARNRISRTGQPKPSPAHSPVATTSKGWSAGAGWDRYLDREREAAAGYPVGVMSAALTCPDCGAMASVTFEPRALRVCFTCPEDTEHGFLRLGGEDHEPLAVWAREGREYIAIALVAPVLAGDDDTWSLVYGTRADDYRATAQALAAFDASNPEPMRLAPDVRCGDCGNRMSLYMPVDLGRGDREEASYSCGIRHGDGRYRNYKKADVDAPIDWELLRLLRRHPSWATAPEIEPSPAALTQYADYLTAKIATYDARIGAASKDSGLSRQRAELDDTLKQVNAMREQGAFAVAGLVGSQVGRWYIGTEPAFTDLVRALLTTDVQATEATIAVSTPFDAGTPLYRTLRVREIRQELTDLRRRQQELTEELAQLGAAD
jgi:hypothetical protein